MASFSSVSKATGPSIFEERLSFVRQELDPSCGITNLLQIEDVFTLEESTSLRGDGTKLEQSTALLSAVVKKGPEACTKFIKVLEKAQPFLAECIRKFGNGNQKSVLENLAVVSKEFSRDDPIVPAGGAVLNSGIVPAAELVVPVGALVKSVTMGIEVTPVPRDFSNAKFGDKVSVGPVVAILPRRRKFHKELLLKIPLPTWTTHEHVRLMCCIAVPNQPTIFEDVTYATELKTANGQVAFNTTVSALFWPIVSKTPLSPLEAEAIANSCFEEASTRYLTSILLGSCEALGVYEAPPPTYDEAMMYSTKT